MAVASRNFFINILTSGKPFDFKKEEEMDQAVHYILLNSMIFLGSTLLVSFGFESLAQGAILQAIFDFVMGAMTIVSFILLRAQDNFFFSAIMSVVPVGFLYMWLAQSGGVQGSGVLWSYSYPLLAIFLLGRQWGGILSLALLLALGGLVLIPGVSAYDYQTSFALRTVGVYILVLICSLVYEQTKVAKERWVQTLTTSLKDERDEIAAMKDNIKDGLFLVDGDHFIQPQYSKVLEGILGLGELSGKSLIDILRGSIADHDLPNLIDYLVMVRERQFDQAMLDDINPLSTLEYRNTADGTEKHLVFSFAPVDRQSTTLILVTVSDQTQAFELKKQIEGEEARRQEEMRALFEVIHVEPRVLNDFIEDAEAEFHTINKLLKDTSLDSAQIIVQLYQSVHAIKSNAVILGLDVLGNKLHGLEQELSIFRRATAVPFQEMLRITVMLEAIQREVDHLKDLIQKIVAFKFGEGRMQEHYVIVRTLERVVERVSQDLGRHVKLIIKAMDPQALTVVDRRAVKDILIQLLRNAMYHGLENPEERVAAGKEETGRVTVSVSMEGKQVVISLGDDGRGLNFDKIAQKAKTLGILPSDKEAFDKNTLLQTIFNPGFSTRDEADLHAGRGMGLSMVRDKVREFKGTIKIQSDEGRGTQFRIALPTKELRDFASGDQGILSNKAVG